MIFKGKSRILCQLPFYPELGIWARSKKTKQSDYTAFLQILSPNWHFDGFHFLVFSAQLGEAVEIKE